MADCSPVFNGLLFPYCKSLLYLTSVLLLLFILNNGSNTERNHLIRIMILIRIINGYVNALELLE